MEWQNSDKRWDRYGNSLGSYSSVDVDIGATIVTIITLIFGIVVLVTTGSPAMLQWNGDYL